jgi:hypothetical protein
MRCYAIGPETCSISTLREKCHLEKVDRHQNPTAQKYLIIIISNEKKKQKLKE